MKNFLALAFAMFLAVGVSYATPVAVPTDYSGNEKCTQTLPCASGAAQVAVAVAPTVTASSAYASGNVVGGLLVLPNMVRLTGGTAILQKVVVDFKTTQTAQLDLVLFANNPTGTTFTDKAAFSLAAADFNRVIGTVHITDCTSLGTPSVCQASGLALPIQGQGSTTVYGVLVTRGTPTYGSTSDIQLILQALQD